MIFNQPDKKQIGRMTPQTVTALLSSLKVRRNQVVAPLDRQIQYYEYLLQFKQGKITEDEFNTLVLRAGAQDA